MSFSSKFRLGSAIVVLAAGLVGCNHSPAQSVTIFTLQPYPILDDSIKGIRQALKKRGYDDTRLVTELNANGQKGLVSTYAKEIVAAHPDVVVPVSTPITKAVLNEARLQASPGKPLQPIVFSTVTNPNDAGMDRHPPNVTGVSDLVDYEANIALIREMFPLAKRIGVIYDPGDASAKFGMDKIKIIAEREHLDLRVVPVSAPTEVPDAARAIVKAVDLVYVGSDNTVTAAMTGLVAICTSAKIPVMASDSGSVEKGALAAVSVDYVKLGETVGNIVADILQTKVAPGKIPNVIYVGKTLLVNGGMAAKLGVTVPPAVRNRAERIIE